MRSLKRERGKIGGDVYAMTVFLMMVIVFAAVAGIAGNSDEANEFSATLQECVDDLGVEHSLIEKLQNHASILQGKEGINKRDIGIVILDMFLHPLLTALLNKQTDIEDQEARHALAKSTNTLRTNVRSIDDKLQRRQLALTEAFLQHDDSLHEALTLISSAPSLQNISPDELAEIVDEPAQLYQRVKRWMAGAEARDGLEAALWAALDFVPMGNTLKLGYVFIKALRKATR